MELNEHEVDYASYCDRCKYALLECYEDPCDECTDTWKREGTTIPINFEQT